MQKVIQEIANFLAKDDRYTISIYNKTDGQRVRLQGRITLNEIIQKAENLEDYLKGFYSEKVKVIGIEKVRPNGSSIRREEIEVVFQPKEINDKPREVVNKGAQGEQVQPAYSPAPFPQQASVQPYPQQQPLNPMQYGHGMNAAFGMNAAQVTSLMVKAERYQDVRDQLTEEKELRRKAERHNEALIVENRSLQTKLDIAEARKELEIEKVESQKRPFMEPETVQAMAGVFTPLLERLAPAAPVGMAGTIDVNAKDLSKHKNELVSLISDDSVPDGLAMELGYVLVGMQYNQDFLQHIREGLQKFNIIDK